ncbi:CAMK/CAMKL protein kinase, variant [Phytophthora nicotianae]|uniref:non-specific serine/threonine protein kinase n=2 Tax=Phytophthora nicotianae TaxID=4792 RepID=W2PJP0_PHYN3|nr:CAMK/CAMKL protein kinase [Phytophthora nicotianae INRA-310]XP_008913638.1 CAMK/CAMKL protein kinase, variant [Phytophthora nicotianae INRA-310]ETK74062.1 CAMK/CAMKL protein kinase [Phytophthora nicotianae]ETK74063.1 CAMK/CAMKL protein kinase, variant [Phytophthora nicotianae]ETN01082.1 CAMK/CAMKL protein kinase [Phytophthora nicotianae INRA-310]ETN01083.1 CAMK/CAMKL protein kinase, variant [Phytophthora nicotianae INRA-310]
MMNERRRKLQTIQVDHYDGQAIYSGNELIYELGGYLGGGAAGVVYEAFSTRTKQHVAIKILNPVGYKLFPSTLLARCIVAVKGKPLVLPSDEAELDDDAGQRANRRVFAGGNHRMRSNFGSPKGTTERIRVENVWWLIHPTSKQAIAAFEDPHTGHVRELTLPQCIQVWGEQMNQSESGAERQQTDPAELYQEVQVKNQTIKVPRIPKKFIKFAHTRRSIHREISNMSGLEYHENVLRLDEALELVQDSKCTTFLVLELAGGGELFDRIKLDCGTSEETARLYFRQLISGVAFCHNSGVCHRDLKPENLLLADNEEHSTLKIADFGLSAIFAITDSDASVGANGNGVDQPAIRRLRSVVGSPHYVAPEVLMDAGQGYDGAKADAWSIGIILYAMIAGNLPFGKDLLKCVRYDRFRKWSYNTKYSDDDPTDEVEFPTWFFPAHFSMELKSLIAQLLYPDACMRLSVEEAQRHTWVRGEKLKKPCPSMSEDDQPSNSAALSPPGLPPAPHPTHKNRMNVAINTLQDGIELGQHMHPSQLGAVSPQAITRLLTKSPSPHGHAFRCPPSPQQNLRVNKHLAGVVGYMPPLDETSSMSGQTPINSPRDAKNNDNFESDREDASMISSTKELNACNISEAGALFKQEALVREATVTTSMNLAVREIGGENVAGSAHLVQQTVTRQHRFVSPPLVTGPRDTMPIRLRRNSPPELFLRGFARGHFRELSKGDVGNTSGFDGINILGRSPPLLPQSIVTRDDKPGVPINRMLTEPLAFAATSGESKDVQAEQQAASVPPPSYSDVVARSTRFLTALPARLVLSNVENALKTTPCPLPYEYPTVPQNVSIDWDNYQLEVRYGNLLTCTVQVFLFQRGVYLVEFRRGHVDIFQFKRFYEKIRAQISEGMDGGSERPSPAFRKRNNSISETF